MRSGYIKHRAPEELYAESDTITAYWRVIAHLASWMLLGGFLVLPTTFDKDAELRMTSGVMTIVIVALLTGGYSLTALLWFACPSIIFRLQYIFIPAASASIFGLFATAWVLAISPRYNVSAPSCPLTVVATIVSASVYGGLAIYTNRRIKTITSSASHAAHQSWAESGYYTPYASSTYPLTGPGMPSESVSISHSVSQPVLTEDELVNQQMAALLTKTNPGPSPDATQETFKLQWPTGDEEEDDPTARGRTRTFTMNGRHLAAPGYALQTIKSRANTSGVGEAFSKIGRVIGIGDRGRTQAREEALATERAKSREERRRQIEMGL